MTSNERNQGLHKLFISYDNRVEMKKSPNENVLNREVTSWEDVFILLNHDHRPTFAIRDNLARYLKAQIESTKLSESEQTASAYKIAGLLSAQGTHHLSPDDPISKVLVLAGQVELPAQHRATTDTWHQLVKSIDQL